MSHHSIDVSTSILNKNERLASELRQRFADHGVVALNLLSGPGAGKTSTILATMRALGPDVKVAVIEGDIASDVDAIKVKEAGATAVQINTGGICHLEGQMIIDALEVIDLDSIDLLIIENVGNLVCTVDFDLGCDLTAMILSVPEGNDKTLKYPGIFQASDAIILNKVDTMSVFDFDREAFYATLDDLNPSAPVFEISAVKDLGVTAWADFLRSKLDAKRAGQGC